MQTRGIRSSGTRLRALLAVLSIAPVLAASGCATVSDGLDPSAELNARIYGAPDMAEVLRISDPETRRTRALRAVARARQAERQGDPEEAFHQYQRAYALAPDEDDADHYAGELVRLSTALQRIPELPAGAQALFDQAQQQTRSEQYAEAEALLRKVKRAAPWSPKAHYQLALLLAGQERYAAASSHMEGFLRLTADSEQAEEARDLLFRWRGQVPAATP